MTANGLQSAFVERLDRHRAILFKVANAYCRNAGDRADLVQEMIVQLWRSYGRFDDRAAFPTWMYRIAVNVAISFIRSQRRKPQNVPAEAGVLEEVAAPQEAETDDRMTIVRDLIEQLDPLNRALMILYLDDYPYSEIATILGISETNVGSKIGRIKERLKRNIAGRTGR
jgi:RNA polymerase sigma factor (sigma-70 family)